MIVFLIVRDLVQWPAAMVDALLSWRATPIVLDMASTYPPCVRWLEHDCPCVVVRVGRNLGHVGPWVGGYVDRLVKGDWYAVSDGDLDLTDVPADALEQCRRQMERHPHLCKVGLSLRLDDIPGDVPHRQQILDWESQFWPPPVDGLHFAALDTTLAVYDLRRPYTPGQIHPAGRLAKPYTASHIPWTLAPHRYSEEFRYYLDRIERASDWGRRLRDHEEATREEA